MPVSVFNLSQTLYRPLLLETRLLATWCRIGHSEQLLTAQRMSPLKCLRSMAIGVAVTFSTSLGSSSAHQNPSAHHSASLASLVGGTSTNLRSIKHLLSSISISICLLLLIVSSRSLSSISSLSPSTLTRPTRI